MDNKDYILDFLALDNSHLGVIEKQHEARDYAVPAIGPEVGKILGLIIRAIGATRVMEFGTSLGYSTVWLAEAMKATRGRLIAIELNDRLYEDTRNNLAEAGLSEYVELMHGDASRVIDDVEGPFDLILQDSSKPLYPVMLEKTIDLVRVQGILAADDGLFLPLGFEKQNAEPIHHYNELVFADPRLYSTILPIGDGLTLSVKLKD